MLLRLVLYYVYLSQFSTSLNTWHNLNFKLSTPFQANKSLLAAVAARTELQASMREVVKDRCLQWFFFCERMKIYNLFAQYWNIAFSYLWFNEQLPWKQLIFGWCVCYSNKHALNGQFTISLVGLKYNFELWNCVLPLRKNWCCCCCYLNKRRKYFPLNPVASSLEMTDQGRDWYSWWWAGRKK